MTALWLFFVAAPLPAHVISMSNGDIRIDGSKAVYELRVPLYEVQHVRNPEKTLLENIRFSTSGVAARMVRSKCGEDKDGAVFRCEASYEWPLPVDVLEVSCTFHSITVPNHVHLLRAYLGEKTGQAVFDFSSPNASIRFRPPTPFETFVTAAGSGFARAFSSGAAVLFLACLVLAARTRQELVWLTAMFILGEALVAVIVPRTSWNPAPRFVEAALALTIAYLAVEILTLPEAGQRWLVALVLGAFHGLSYALYLANTGFDATPVLAGMSAAETAAIALFDLILSRLARIFSSIAPTAHKITATCLLLTGLAWFFYRLKY
jgi:hypothetical protein